VDRYILVHHFLQREYYVSQKKIMKYTDFCGGEKNEDFAALL